MDNETFVNSSIVDPNNGASGGGTSVISHRIELGVQIGLYSVIFLLAVLGNALVILTLVQNRGMRTITNLFLLNLAVADLLVGVLCIPFTLTSIVLKYFVFGPILCKIIPFLQAVSVSVSAWTLVAISVERYYAICHPLTSRRWQTLYHAYKIIAVVWVSSLLCMLPIVYVSVLVPIRQTGRYKCREIWPSVTLEKAYTVFLDIVLLVLPLVIMTVKYALITMTLGKATGNEECHEQSGSTSGLEKMAPPSTASPSSNPRITVTLSSSPNGHENGRTMSFKSAMGGGRKSNSRSGSSRNGTALSRANLTSQNNLLDSSSSSSGGAASQSHHLHHHHHHVPQHQVLRRCNVAMSLRRKKRVIQMLGVVVAEFFICWTPIYVMNTWYLFYPVQLYSLIGPMGVTSIQLLAYFSSCCNPITYCFMNQGFRMAFFRVFGCHWDDRHQQSNSQRIDSLRLNRLTSVYRGSYNNHSSHNSTYYKNNKTCNNI